MTEQYEPNRNVLPWYSGMEGIDNRLVRIINPARLPSVQLAWATTNESNEILSLRQDGREIAQLPDDQLEFQPLRTSEQLGKIIDKAFLLTP